VINCANSCCIAVRCRFIVSLAGPGVTGQQIIIRQSQDIGRISGEKESDIKESTETNKKLYAILRKEKDNKKAEIKILARYREIWKEKNFQRRYGKSC